MLKQLRPAIASVLAFTILLGLIFPALITVISKAVMPAQANGSLITRNGKVVGSTLIGQPFAKPIYFHPRPSAAGNGYDASASGGSNLGPTSDKLINGIADDPKTKDTDESFAGIKQLAAAYQTENGLAPDAKLPADAVTKSASGLDPEISPENAALQAPRVARARKISVETVKNLVAQNTQNRSMGVLGEARVNVLNLNLALDAAK
ncbi:K+-transporting ATPase ATPase C chain [Abditibacterium utsteinense]|uniref:Potassium-transporting ATPase KdpC subunit n=1 Tax=Abditibacterium utsteinense TaxID=1960156 RepID=A0A2S8SPR2_9BACT|nr:potassium-transporting ATPase subunit KdpC [Abditibacterium utsteinense]PQV62790.1 K+-transporting ATPase ATPase C chain [Abditibacterium utsteinense]